MVWAPTAKELIMKRLGSEETSIYHESWTRDHPIRQSPVLRNYPKEFGNKLYTIILHLLWKITLVYQLIPISSVNGHRIDLITFLTKTYMGPGFSKRLDRNKVSEWVHALDFHFWIPGFKCNFGRNYSGNLILVSTVCLFTP